jgi:hypothetical protein
MHEGQLRGMSLNEEELGCGRAWTTNVSDGRGPDGGALEQERAWTRQRLGEKQVGVTGIGNGGGAEVGVKHVQADSVGNCDTISAKKTSRLCSTVPLWLLRSERSFRRRKVQESKVLQVLELKGIRNRPIY